MIIEVRLAETPLRRWHLELIERLASLPHTQVTLASTGPTHDSRKNAGQLEQVFRLERFLHGRRPGLAALEDPGPAAAVPATAGVTPDIRLDLSTNPLADSRTWRLEFDGRAGESAAVEALRAGAPPVVSVVRPDGTTAASGRPGSETPGVIAAAFDDLLAGCLAVIMKAFTSSESASPTVVPLGDLHPPSLTRHAVRQTVGAIAHMGYRALYRAPHWRVGWRFADGPGVIDTPGSPPSGWQDLPDDGLRFYADPFPFVHNGELLLFVEDYEHRVGRGVISVVRFDESGPTHVPTPVLEHRVHLSYPFVLEDEGEVWMIPETSAAGTIELYRASSFPDRWSLDSILVEGVEASDATVFKHDDGWWMTATVRSGGSFSDALHVWYADRLRGPWTPHPHNPVLIDIASARPAGRVEHRGDRLLRPVQDCRSGYGAALAVAEITRLDKEHFDQRVTDRLVPGPWWPGRRLHTLNRAGRLECIDGSAMAPRYWDRRDGKKA